MPCSIKEFPFEFWGMTKRSSDFLVITNSLSPVHSSHCLPNSSSRVLFLSPLPCHWGFPCNWHLQLYLVLWYAFFASVTSEYTHDTETFETWLHWGGWGDDDDYLQVILLVNSMKSGICLVGFGPVTAVKVVNQSRMSLSPKLIRLSTARIDKMTLRVKLRTYGRLKRSIMNVSAFSSTTSWFSCTGRPYVFAGIWHCWLFE